MRLHHNCDIIKFKDDIYFYLDFEGYTDHVTAKFLVSSEDVLDHDITFFEKRVCESFIYKYTRERIIGDEGLLKALLWGTPHFFIADALNAHFNAIEDKMEVQFAYETRGNEASTRLSPMFGAPDLHIFFETRDITEEHDELWIDYRQIAAACIGLDRNGLIHAKFEQNLNEDTEDGF